ncbi:MAG: hypothetical protein RL641_602 [Candidatus Parcubacteria bacterium]|jgi:prepilin-type N-terminal cleavage/methylation domain-containing protein
MKFVSRKNKNSTDGFTIVETLVAVAIFSVSISAVISVSAKGITSTTNSKNRIVANYLAQEEVEYIRHLRNKYSEAPGVAYTWADFVDLVTPCDTKTQPQTMCAIADPTIFNPATTTQTTEVFKCQNLDECQDYPVYLDTNGYFYQSSLAGTGTATIFHRYFTVEINPTNKNEVKLIASVFWKERNNAEKNVTLTETLTNWLPVSTP